MPISPVYDDQANARPCTPAGALRLMKEPRIMLALAAIYVLWGTSYLAIKQAGVDFPPLLLVGLRNLTAGIFLMCLVRYQNRPWGTPRLWVNAAMVGVLMISVGGTLLVMGLQHVTSGFAAVAFAAVPVVVCFVMVARGLCISRAQWIGIFVGVSGLLLMNHGTVGLQEGTSVWLILAAVVATAASAVLMDHLPMPKDLLVTAGVQMMVGGGVAALLGWFMGERLGTLSIQAVGVWLYLSLLVSVLGYLSYVYLMTNAGPIVASSYAYVNPPIASLAGALLLGEPISGQTLVATGVVLIGAMTVLIATPPRMLRISLVPPKRKIRPYDAI